jgi:phosphoribosylformimino-5-aminoimidazole carboxamide ribonucleotide (ProFAR) isomerase
VNLAELTVPMTLLRTLAIDHPNLPALHVHLSPHQGGRVDLSIHDDLGSFEAWREALGIDPSAVRRNLQSGDMTMVLTAHGEVEGTKVQLTGYAPNVLLAVAS